jgi:hypothetical protein
VLRRAARRGAGISALLLALGAGHAYATVAPPVDSLRVEFLKLDSDEPATHLRLRLVRYTTTGIAPATTAFTGLALRLPDSLTITGVDSALVVLPGTQIPSPEFPVLLPDTAIVTAFRAQPSAPAGGFWLGVRGGVRTLIGLPHEPVDVCWFVRIAASAGPTSIPFALLGATAASASTNGARALSGNVAFKHISKARPSMLGGGSGGRRRDAPLAPANRHRDDAPGRGVRRSRRGRIHRARDRRVRHRPRPRGHCRRIGRRRER